MWEFEWWKKSLVCSSTTTTMFVLFFFAEFCRLGVYGETVFAARAKILFFLAMCVSGRDKKRIHVCAGKGITLLLALVPTYTVQLVSRSQRRIGSMIIAALLLQNRALQTTKSSSNSHLSSTVRRRSSSAKGGGGRRKEEQEEEGERRKHFGVHQRGRLTLPPSADSIPALGNPLLPLPSSLFPPPPPPMMTRMLASTPHPPPPNLRAHQRKYRRILRT